MRVEALSPIRHLDRLRAPLIVAYATCQAPELQRQNREFDAAIEARHEGAASDRRALQPSSSCRRAL